MKYRRFVLYVMSPHGLDFSLLMFILQSTGQMNRMVDPTVILDQ